MPKHFGTTDCETDPFLEGRVPQPFLWGVYLDTQFHQFRKTEDYLAFISELDDTILYAHNGGKFDYHYLLDAIESDEKITIINGRLARFRIGKCEMRDSLNLIPAPLSRFEKTKIDYNKFEADVREQHMAEISNYLLDDCRILYNVLEQYFAEYGNSLTQAGSAMKVWKKRFGGENFLPQTEPQATAMRPYYFGGRVECLTYGEHRKPFVGVDRNSAYPHAMLSRHPISPSGTGIDTMPSDNDLPLSFVNLTCVSDGAFPLRMDDGSVTFPNDGVRREYHVTGHEIIAALEHDAVRDIDVHVALVFSMSMTFEEYVRYFFAKRQEYKALGNEALDYFCKIFLNALYGKFGADPENYDEMLICDEENIEYWLEHEYIGTQQFGKRFMMSRKLPEEKRHYYNVATAASITGMVRADMFRALRSVDNPYYCDTDGIYARGTGNLDLGSELGQWKLELKGRRFAIAGRKTYAFCGDDKSDKLHEIDSTEANGGRWKIACKGARLSPRRIIEVANGKDFEYSPIVPTYSIHRTAPTFIKRKISRTNR